jgi:hypothetical protein
MRFGRKIGLICVVLVASVTSSACAGSPMLREPGGCGMLIRGVTGVVRPESSNLTCAAVKEIIDSVPSKPQKYLVISESPHLLWKCQLYPVKAQGVLLRCAHRQKHFSIVKDTG